VISVIVPVKDGGDDLRRCLDGIAKQRTSDQIETLVVDSGSTDGSLELARSSGARVLEVAPSDFRHGATRNLAADNARGELLVFTTQDAYAADTQWLERLCAPLRSDEDVAGVYGRQIPHPDAIPPERFLLSFLYGPEARVQRASHSSALALWTTLFSNSNSALRREFWEQHPFADDIFWAEDQDWARRVLLAGYAIRYEPAAAVHHSHTNTVRTAFKRAFDTGVAANRGFLSGGSTSSAVFRREALRYAREELAWLVRTNQRRWIPYAIAYELGKLLGIQLGARHRMLPAWMKKRCSTLPAYWTGQ
jgi:rhamnosyltransferase